MNNDYIVKYIKTKSKRRKIVTYSEGSLMRIKHTNILHFMSENTFPSKFSKGYVKNQSIYTNSYAHMYNDIFIKFDIKSFFNNINHSVLIEQLHKELKKREPKILKQECTTLINMCSVSDKGIPLGLITSPFLSNIYLKEFDNIFYGKLKKLNLKNIIYTRYADDIVISYKYQNSSILNEDFNIIKEIIVKCLRRYHLILNEKKQQFVNLNCSNHVRITGISIAKIKNNRRKLSVGRNQKRKLYYRAINCYINGQEDKMEVKRIKGLQSFYLSIEKVNYESFLSNGMKKVLKDLGYDSLKRLIDNLRY